MSRSFKDITVVSVTGSVDYIQGSIYAIERSCRELPGSKALLISPPLPENTILPSYIEHIVCSPFSYFEYNIFMIYQLDYFIHTDYCLIVQNDGWVMDGKLWRDEFWHYDYIGAPLPTFGYFSGTGEVKFTPSNEYFEYPNRLNSDKYWEVQNGGFCLRSKKLLGMPRKLNLKMPISPPVSFEYGHSDYKMRWQDFLHNEDIFLSGLCRPLLEEYGIKFATPKIAAQFAFESPIINKIRGVALSDIFGSHGFGHITLIESNKVKIKVPEEARNYSIEDIRRLEFIALFINLGFEVEFIF